MTSEGILTPSELTKTEISIQQDACFRNMDSSVLVLLVRQRNNAASLNPCENTTGRHKGRAQSIGRTARSTDYTLCLCLAFLIHKIDSEAGNQIG